MIESQLDAYWRSRFSPLFCDFYGLLLLRKLVLTWETRLPLTRAISTLSSGEFCCRQSAGTAQLIDSPNPSYRHRAAYDKETIYGIVKAAAVLHVAFVDREGLPRESDPSPIPLAEASKGRSGLPCCRLI